MHFGDVLCVDQAGRNSSLNMHGAGIGQHSSVHETRHWLDSHFVP